MKRIIGVDLSSYEHIVNFIPKDYSDIVREITKGCYRTKDKLIKVLKINIL